MPLSPCPLKARPSNGEMPMHGVSRIAILRCLRSRRGCDVKGLRAEPRVFTAGDGGYFFRCHRVWPAAKFPFSSLPNDRGEGPRVALRIAIMRCLRSCRAVMQRLRDERGVFTVDDGGYSFRRHKVWPAAKFPFSIPFPSSGGRGERWRAI